MVGRNKDGEGEAQDSVLGGIEFAMMAEKQPRPI